MGEYFPIFQARGMSKSSAGQCRSFLCHHNAECIYYVFFY